jgi:putative ABC transport system permease protein
VIGKYLPLLVASLRRKRLRTTFTLASIAIAFLLFGLAESMRNAFQSGVDIAGADRLLTMHKVSFTMLLPASYENRIRAVDGVLAVVPQTWFGAWYRDQRNQIPAFPTDPQDMLRIYREYQIPEAQKQDWLADRSGILIGRGLADLYGWKPGDAVPLRSAIWRREDGSDTWPVTVRAVYDLASGGDTRQIFLNQEYFEEAKAFGKGQVGWYVVQVRDPDDVQRVSKSIDELFANSPAETKTSSERAMAQSVRERTSEIGVLKTLGYSSPGVLGLVLSESVLITVLGGMLGIAVAWWVGVQFEPVFSRYLPGFRMPQSAVLRALLFMLALGLVAGAVPVLRIGRSTMV